MDENNPVRQQAQEYRLNFLKKEVGSLAISKIPTRHPKYHTQQNKNRNPVLNEITKPLDIFVNYLKSEIRPQTSVL